MGGRGQTFAGGSTGGNAQPISTESLLSASGKRQEIMQVMDAVKRVSDEYGQTLEDIQIATMGKGGERVMAYYDSGGNLAVNKNYFDSKKMDKAYDECVKMGFHPPRGKKSGLEATAAHELGHKLTDAYAQKMGMGSWQLDKASNQIIKEAKKKLGYKKMSDVSKRISGYGSSSNAEAIAEAFSDVYCNGKRAKKESKAIVSVLDSALKKKGGN